MSNYTNRFHNTTERVVNHRGMVTIPQFIRDAAGIKEGDTVTFAINYNGDIVIIREVPRV